MADLLYHAVFEQLKILARESGVGRTGLVCSMNRDADPVHAGAYQRRAGVSRSIHPGAEAGLRADIERPFAMGPRGDGQP